MNCSNCNNEFNFIEGLKFCPYCGSRINMQFENAEDNLTAAKDKASIEDDSISGEAIGQEFAKKDFFKERAFKEDRIKINSFRKPPMKDKAFIEKILQDKDLEKNQLEEKISLENNIGDEAVVTEKGQDEKVVDQVNSPSTFHQSPSISETVEREEKITEGSIHDTLRMPPITNEMLEANQKEKNKRKNKTLSTLKRIFTSKLLIVGCLTVLVLGLVVYIGSAYLLNTKVDEAQIKKDLIGKTITLPKGTQFKVKEGSIKNLSIGERVFNDEDKVEYIDLTATLNDGKIEVSGVIQLSYKKADNNKWQLLDTITLKKDIVVKPVAGMEEAGIIEVLKNKTISLLNHEISLSDSMVTRIAVVERKPKYNEGKEKLSVEVIVDGGVLTAKGTINGELSFVDEKWVIDGDFNYDEEDFEIDLSKNLSEDVIVDEIKNRGDRQNVNHDSIFGGQSFLIDDEFTNSVTIESKELNDDKTELYLTVKKENESGMLKAILTAEYVFGVSLTDLSYYSNNGTTVDEVVVAELTRDMIVQSLSGAEIEGRRGVFWWDNNHRLTEDEAKTYQHDEILSKAGYQNNKYVYGQITYDDDGEQKTVDMVAIYYLTHDTVNGYQWQLDGVVSSESNRYKHYTKENIEE